MFSEAIKREQFLLRFDLQDNDRAYGLLPNSTQVISYSLAELADKTADRISDLQLVLVVPASKVLLSQAQVPSRSKKQIRNAVPYVLEEQLSASVDELHFALGDQAQDGQVDVAVISRLTLDGWLARCKQAALHVEVVCIDVLGLPYEENHWTVSLAPDQTSNNILVRTGAQQGLATDQGNINFIMQSLLAEHEDKLPQVIDIYAAPQQQQLDTAMLQEADIRVVYHDPSDDILLTLAQDDQNQHTINLLQGDYGRQEQLGKLWRPWRPALALLAVIFVFNILNVAVEGSRIITENQSLKQEITNTFRTTFPQSKNVSHGNARIRMARKLKALQHETGGGDHFFIIYSAIAQPLMADSGIELKRFSYKDGQLDLALVLTDLASVDKLKKALSKNPSIEVKVQSASARNDRVDARLTIRIAS